MYSSTYPTHAVAAAEPAHRSSETRVRRLLAAAWCRLILLVVVALHR
jgi:hypothetical protein